MAIAFNAATDVSSTTGSTSHTFSHTCSSGADRILFVAVTTITPNNSDQVSGVTYGGVAMTRVNTVALAGFQWRQYLYYLVAPATGANNVVISTTGSTNIYGSAADYTGASQTGVPDASNTANSSGSPLSLAVTTVADNSWAILVGSNVDANFAASTGSTLRTSNQPSQIFDSGGPKTPAGSLSMSLTYAGTREYGLCMASFAPAVAAGPTNLKSLDGNLKANSKSYNGNVLANTKSISGNS